MNYSQNVFQLVRTFFSKDFKLLFLKVSLKNNLISCLIEEIREIKEIEILDIVPKDVNLTVDLNSFFHPKDQNSFELGFQTAKCIRRGGHAGVLLEETIRKMRKNPPYNLPELQFLRVNSNRQIFWRLFISYGSDSQRKLELDHKINILKIFSMNS